MSRRTPRHSLRATLALGVVVPLLALGGCSGDDPEPKIAPTTSTSPSDTGSPSPTPTGPVEPTMPAAAKKQTAAGAEAFVRYYLDIVNFSQSSGDLRTLRRIADRECGACSAGLHFLERTFSEGGEIRGGSASLTRATSGLLNTGDYQVRGDLVSRRQVVDMPGSRRDKVYPGGTITVQFIVSPEDHSWLVAYWDKAPS
ncbi:MAG: hypothetical protein JWO76_916 [Nocardioides sp.]|nr:hypothetical protein [Nocardioides sp.]